MPHSSGLLVYRPILTLLTCRLQLWPIIRNLTCHLLYLQDALLSLASVTDWLSLRDAVQVALNVFLSGQVRHLSFPPQHLTHFLHTTFWKTNEKHYVSGRKRTASFFLFWRSLFIHTSWKVATSSVKTLHMSCRVTGEFSKSSNPCGVHQLLMLLIGWVTW